MPEELPATLITWEEVYSLCRQLASQLRKANFRIDVIVAIARGGFVPGRLLSQNHFQAYTRLLCRDGQRMAMAYVSLGG